jgi:hypothetical protein
MTNRESFYFSSNVPIVANGFYAPPYWDDIIEYDFATINFQCDVKCKLTIYQSTDKLNISWSRVVVVEANRAFQLPIQLNTRYFKLRVDNATATNSTIFALQTIYKQNAPNPTNNTIQIFNGATGANGVSVIVPINLANKQFSFFGNVDGMTNLIVQMSSDSVNWYDSQYSYTSSTAADFGFNITLCSPYIRLKSSADVNCICYLSYN